MQCPVSIVIARNKYFGLSHVGFGRRSLVRSLKVVMVISVILHHQQCYIFREIKQENTKWTAAVV